MHRFHQLYTTAVSRILIRTVARIMFDAEKQKNIKKQKKKNHANIYSSSSSQNIFKVIIEKIFLFFCLFIWSRHFLNVTNNRNISNCWMTGLALDGWWILLPRAGLLPFSLNLFSILCFFSIFSPIFYFAEFSAAARPIKN